MTTQNYDVRLGLYQTLFEVPSQVLISEVYEKLGKGKPSSYAVCSLLGIGAFLGSLSAAKLTYELIHGAEGLKADPDTNYYVSPLAEYLHDYNIKAYENASPENKNKYLQASTDILKQAPAYSQTYMSLAYCALATKSAYGTLNSGQTNPLYALLYGLSQPVSVLLADRS